MLTLDLIQEEDLPDGLRVTVDKSPTSCSSTPAASSPDPQRLLSPDSAHNGTATSGDTHSKSQSLPRQTEAAVGAGGGARTPQPGRKLTAAEKSRCASMDEILTHSEPRHHHAIGTSSSTGFRKGGMGMPHCSASAPAASLHPVSQLQELICQKLERTQELLVEVRRGSGGVGGGVGERDSGARAEAERLLEEATSTWGQARDVLEEVKELRALCKQLDSGGGGAAGTANGTLSASASASPITANATPSGKVKSPQQTNYRKSLM